MTGYIYNTESREVVASLISNSQSLIESTANDLGVDAETYSLTYSPAFGSNDGLIEADAPEYDLDQMTQRYIVYTVDGKEIADETTEREARDAAEKYDRAHQHSATHGDLCRVETLSIADQITL